MACKKMIVAILILGLAVLAAGCSDSKTTVLAAPDTAPPAVPSNFEAQFEGNAAYISWAANTTDADLAGFVLTRTHQGTVLALVQTPTMITDFMDPSPALGYSTYQAYAVDTSGNQSAVASAYLLNTRTHEPTGGLSND